MVHIPLLLSALQEANYPGSDILVKVLIQENKPDLQSTPLQKGV